MKKLLNFALVIVLSYCIAFYLRSFLLVNSGMDGNEKTIAKVSQEGRIQSQEDVSPGNECGNDVSD